MDGIGQEKSTTAMPLRARRQRSVLHPMRGWTSVRARSTRWAGTFQVMSREIVRESGVMMLLGVMRAEERLAAFCSIFPAACSTRILSAGIPLAPRARKSQLRGHET